MQGPSLIRTFLIFFAGGLLLTAAAISIFLIGNMIWLHCLHDDPSQTCGDALFYGAASPIYGIIIGMGVNFLPLAVGALLAVTGRAFFRRLPLWYVIAILPACALAYVAQNLVLVSARPRASLVRAPARVLGAADALPRDLLVVGPARVRRSAHVALPLQRRNVTLRNTERPCSEGAHRGRKHMSIRTRPALPSRAGFSSQLFPSPTYFASGSGRSWNFTSFGTSPLPMPSPWNGVRLPELPHTPRPFQPPFGSSMRPSNVLA
jgi:hypothetical protein